MMSPLAAVGEESVHAQYYGSKLGISINYLLHINHQDAAAPVPQWMQLPQDRQTPTRTLAPGQPWVHIMLQHSLLGSTTITNSILEPQHGLAVQRIVARPRDTYTRYKATQFASNGIRELRLRHSPPSALINWTRARLRHHPYPQGFEGGAGVSDTSALFYLLGSSDLQQPGGRIQTTLFSNGELMMVELRAGKVVSVNTRYIQVTGDSQQQITGPRDALRVYIQAQALAADSSKSDLTVLGIQGDLHMLIDREHHIPLRITGRVPWLGQAELQLQRLDLLTHGSQNTRR